jgi:hypothetical protein
MIAAVIQRYTFPMGLGEVTTVKDGFATGTE